jgi:lipopolysaccharide transport system ATP-binding protein
LEVGTGFHPELTGRENIFLNGAILGMRKTEIERKFDEIVAFAEIEKFMDTPVKYYSSGMYVRLAFAVAAHLEPEILLVDEVLAVGDAAFQKKCLGKMGDVAKEGRTVLFVSHNMGAIQSLCERAFLLDIGKLINQGPTQKVVQHYLQSAISPEAIPLDQRCDRSGDGSVRIVSLWIESIDSDKIIQSESRLKITIGYRSEKPVRYPKFLVGIYDYTNTGIFLLDSDAVGTLPEVLPPEGSVICVTEPINLTPGRCFINLALFKGPMMSDYIQYAGYFDVEQSDVYGSGKLPPRNWVLCVLKHKWLLNGG